MGALFQESVKCVQLLGTCIFCLKCTFIGEWLEHCEDSFIAQLHNLKKVQWELLKLKVGFCTVWASCLVLKNVNHPKHQRETAQNSVRIKCFSSSLLMRSLLTAVIASDCSSYCLTTSGLLHLHVTHLDPTEKNDAWGSEYNVSQEDKMRELYLLFSDKTLPSLSSSSYLFFEMEACCPGVGTWYLWFLLRQAM